MQFPITRSQLAAAICSCEFTAGDAEKIIDTLEGDGRIALSGSMLDVKNPTAPDAPSLSGLCREARGGSAGSVGTNKIREYLKGVLDGAPKAGSSRRI